MLSISGATPGYPSLADATSAGLHHINCRHSLGAYIEGLTRRFSNTADPEGDRLRQEQRRLERGIRHWKRRGTVALDGVTKARAAAHRRAWQERLRTLVAEHDLKRLRYREQISA